MQRASATGLAGSLSPQTTLATIVNGHLVPLVPKRDLCAFDLRAQQNLDVLDLDDQISTGQHPAVWDTCHRLVDAAGASWDDLDAIIYRSPPTPTRSVNIAFFSTDAFRAQSWVFVEREDIVVDLVLRHGFTVDWTYGLTGRPLTTDDELDM